MARRRNLTLTTVQILLSLTEGPRHGYGIMTDVRDRTEGHVRLGSGTLYEALQRLEQSGWIAETKPPAGASRADTRYYKLTAAGRQALLRELEHVRLLVGDSLARKLMANG
jgi:PadR family transcriptional regulator PadR